MTARIDSSIPAPDDTEIDEIIAESETLNEALFHLADKYGADVTNNYPGWRDGVYLRHVGDFVGDVLAQVARFAPAPAATLVPAAACEVETEGATVLKAEHDKIVDSYAWGESMWRLAAIEKKRFWTYGPRSWRGFCQFGDDEYQRRTLVLGLPFVGALVFALWRCRCEDCAADLAQLREFVDAPRENF